MMIQNSDKGPIELLSKLVFRDRALPLNIFKKKYQYSLFFDDAINSSDELMLSIKNVIFRCSSTYEFYIFSSSNIDLYCEVNINDDWVERIKWFNNYLESGGYYSGMIFLSKGKDWVLYQENPVRIGVLCLDLMTEMHDIDDDNFVTCEDIKFWLEGNSQQGINIIKAYGESYLKLLLHNYCYK